MSLTSQLKKPFKWLAKETLSNWIYDILGTLWRSAVMTAVIAAVIHYWGEMNPTLRLITALFVCALAFFILQLLVGKWRTRQLNPATVGTSEALDSREQKQIEERAWHETPEYDLTPRKEARPATLRAASDAALPEGAARESQRAKPNLVSLRPEMVFVYTNDVGKIVRSENKPRTATWRMNHPTYVALVVTYHNQPSPSSKVAAARKVSAQITYELSEGKSLFQVPRGVWFLENSSAVDFSINDSHQLILVTVQDAGYLSAARMEYEASGYGMKANLIGLNVSDVNAVNIRVRLVSEADGSIVKESKFRLEGKSDSKYDVRAVSED
jgi:hypothetical protein